MMRLKAIYCSRISGTMMYDRVNNRSIGSNLRDVEVGELMVTAGLKSKVFPSDSGVVFYNYINHHVNRLTKINGLNTKLIT